LEISRCVSRDRKLRESVSRQGGSETTRNLREHLKSFPANPLRGPGDTRAPLLRRGSPSLISLGPAGNSPFRKNHRTEKRNRVQDVVRLSVWLPRGCLSRLSIRLFWNRISPRARKRCCKAAKRLFGRKSLCTAPTEDVWLREATIGCAYWRKPGTDLASRRRASISHSGNLAVCIGTVASGPLTGAIRPGVLAISYSFSYSIHQGLATWKQNRKS